jgi:hypothetical protein
MKALSVLFTIALFIAASQVGAHLRHAHALPAQADRRTDNTNAIDSLTMARFHVSQHAQ